MIPSAATSRALTAFPGGLLHVPGGAPPGGPGKDELFAALAHDLRTPLNLVLLLASDGAANPDLPQAIRADFEAICRHIQIESRLIDELLGSPTLANSLPAVQMQALAIDKVLKDALKAVRLEFDSKHIAIQSDIRGTPLRVWGDETRLKKVFSNVLSNAAAFTPDGGCVEVLCRVEPARKVVVIKISDNGIGLVASEMAALFEPHGKARQSGADPARRAGGLGLALSHMFLEMHSGTIGAASPGRGQGSTFTIELPLLNAVSRADKTGAGWPLTSGPLHTAGKEGASRGRLLLVEDHAPTRETLAHLLGRRHYDVLCASSAAEARSLASNADFQFVISDIGLPDGDGYALMSELRSSHPGLAGIALSGYGMDEDVERSREAGFSAHLVKPVTIAAIEDAIARIP